MVTYEEISELAMENATAYAPKLIGALLTLIIGWIIIKIIVKVIDGRMEKKSIDESLRHFLANLTKVILIILLLISVISMVGVQVTAFIAVLGAAGLAVGLALQGSLANFAGGVLILIFKPFKVGDLVEAQGYLGKVSQIKVFNTILKTPDNKTVIIPNGPLSNGALVNFTTEAIRRVDLTVGISYEDDIKKAKEVLNNIITLEDKALKDPAPQVAVSELGDSSVNFVVRVWCKGEDYWDVFFDMQEKIKLGLDMSKISIPYPQRDVHLYKH
ncbi:mechanosensitive ion channel family protein [Nanoarchaeota archaeon]